MDKKKVISMAGYRNKKNFGFNASVKYNVGYKAETDLKADDNSVKISEHKNSSIKYVATAAAVTTIAGLLIVNTLGSRIQSN
jgi:hypothetical protein